MTSAGIPSDFASARAVLAQARNTSAGQTSAWLHRIIASENFCQRLREEHARAHGFSPLALGIGDTLWTVAHTVAGLVCGRHGEHAVESLHALLSRPLIDPRGR